MAVISMLYMGALAWGLALITARQAILSAGVSREYNGYRAWRTRIVYRLARSFIEQT